MVFAEFIPGSLSLSLMRERWNDLVGLAIHIAESAEAPIRCQEDTSHPEAGNLNRKI